MVSEDSSMSVPEKSLKHQSGFGFKSARKVEDNRKIGSNIRNLTLKLF